MMLHPYGALILGSLAGALSVFGFKFVTPLLSRKLRIHDTCGVNNLHGMPGILAGITSAVIAASATEDEYNYRLKKAGFSDQFLSGLAEALLKEHRLVMRVPLLDPPKEDELFDDYPSWEVEADPTGAEEAASRPPTKGNQIAMVEQQPDSASRARLPAHFNGAYDAPPPAQ
ncbi:hypothetical protein HPB52_010289 [Rhipicephalus sanguineus]|uniref:Ammonium transporter AmtB-like domain-containing protein n=1 Tax=Rhipicephalus sanguineus TaxID=34632 RepID=A0A9D4PR64_RHISA|nr:hypothetical protein HPB52_010289 [Rhipicephalus sanguineus]